MMRQRCNNPNATSYGYYGGKGITICKEWEESYLAFERDMGERPAGTTIDRLDSTKGYYKENCRWATREQQEANKTNKSYYGRLGRSSIDGKR